MSRSLTFERHIEASPDAVFDAFADPAKIARWLAPGPMKAEVGHWEFAVGGTYRLTMRGENAYGLSGGFTSIDRPGHLAFTWKFDDMADQTTVEVHFAADGTGTLMTMVHSGFGSDESRDNHRDGWNGTWPKLDTLCAA